MPYLGEAVRVITIAAMTALFAVTMGWLPISPLMAPEQAPPEVAQRNRFERAAAEICGINASFTEIGNGVIQCATKHGRKTRQGAIK